MRSGCTLHPEIAEGVPAFAGMTEKMGIAELSRNPL